MQPLLEKIVQVARDQVPEESLRVYLFGSWAEGRAVSRSDLDIALDAGRPLPPGLIQRIGDALDELPTLRKIDVVDLQTAGPGFRDRVRQQGELLYGP